MSFRPTQLRIAVVLCAAAWLTAPAVASPETATITYRRVFKGSVPEFIEIKVPQTGKATFDIRQLDDDTAPEAFEVGQPVRDKIFSLALELKNFDGQDFDVHRRIANLGEKTLRYERGAEVHETHFNYTLNSAAAQLQQIFEGLARQEGDLVNLRRAMKYDRLGVNDALRQFEGDLDRRILPEPERLLSVLDQIAADSRVIDIARERARSLAERIRTARNL